MSLANKETSVDVVPVLVPVDALDDEDFDVVDFVRQKMAEAQKNYEDDYMMELFDKFRRYHAKAEEGTETDSEAEGVRSSLPGNP